MAYRIEPTQKALNAIPRPLSGAIAKSIRVNGHPGAEIRRGILEDVYYAHFCVEGDRGYDIAYKGDKIRVGLSAVRECRKKRKNGQIKERVQGAYGDLAEKHVTSHIESLKDAKGAKSKQKRLMELVLEDGRCVSDLDVSELMEQQTHVLIQEVARHTFKSASTMNGIMSAHSRNLTVLVDKGLLDENLSRKLKRPKVNNRRSRKPTPAEMTLHMSKARALGTPQGHAQVLQATFGSRPTDARKLRWSYISADGSTAIIPDSKNGEPAIYVINSLSAAILDECRQWQVDDFVFPSDKRAEGCIAPPRASFEKIRTEVMAEVGTEGVLPPYWQHDFRRAFASTCNAEHGDIRLTQQMLNHKAVTTTERYTFHVPNQLIAASERTAQALFGDLYNEITAAKGDLQ